MQRVASKDSAAELNLRSALHSAGLRFWKNRRIEGINVDVVFPRKKVAIFVDGCFWHGCPLHGTQPKTNTSYWGPKLLENFARDKRQTEKLRGLGWMVIRFWEHECFPPDDRVIRRIKKLVR